MCKEINIVPKEMEKTNKQTTNNQKPEKKHKNKLTKAQKLNGFVI